MKLNFLVMAIVFMVEVNGDDKMVKVGNITTKVLGQSGKIHIYAGENKNDGVVVTFDALKEIDMEGNAIMGGQNKHVYMTFATLAFTFSDHESNKYQDVNVTQFSFMATIKVDEGKNLTATLTTYVYIFTENGTIDIDGQKVSVKSGDVKFNVKIENWPFCGSSGVECKTGNKDKKGTFLDFYIEIKGKNDGAKKDNATDNYDLGGGAKVFVPKLVVYDGNKTENMSTGYPMLKSSGSKQTFVFRFEKFEMSALYDPIVAMQNEDGTDGGNNNTIVNTTKIGALGISADVVGQSGKINIMSSSSKGDSGNKITIEFANLKEVLENGDYSKKKGHTFNSFASQKFDFSAVTENDYMNIPVQRVTFMTTLDNQAMLKVHLLAFKAAGNVTNGDETIMVKPGNMKFNVEITNWSFCTISECTNEVGKYLDFEIVTKGSKKASKQNAHSGKKQGAKYELGSGSMVLSEMVKIDGVWKNMTEGYPKYEYRGNKDMFKFRFNKFTTDVKYDPTFAMIEDGVNAAVKSSSVMAFVVVVCAIISSLFL